VAAFFLAAVNGLNLLELIAEHHAIGIMDALVLAPIGALIVVGDRRHLLAWLLLVDGLVLGTLNVAEQYAPLALGLTPRRLSLPGGEPASWAFVPGIVIGVVFLVLLFPDGRLPSRRWWPLGLAVGTWPLRGPELVTPEGEEPDLAAAPGRCSASRSSGSPNGAAPSVPLSMFAQVRPYGPYLEFLGAALQLAGLGIGIFRFRLWGIDRLVNRTLVYGLLTILPAGVYAGLVLVLGQLSGGLGERTPSWVVAGATLAVAALFQPAAAASRRWWTAASTGPATTPPAPSGPSRPGCATRWTWTPCRPSCWRWSTAPCSRRRRRCGSVPSAADPSPPART
jgi:hypothetical protein